MVGYQPGDAESAVRAFGGRTGHYIFCSTVDVYANRPAAIPIQKQTDTAGLPCLCHNKAAVEQTLLDAHAHPTDFPLTILRPAHTYGEGRGPIHTFGGSTTYLDRIRKGKPIVVHGDGSRSGWPAMGRCGGGLCRCDGPVAHLWQSLSHCRRGVDDLERATTMGWPRHWVRRRRAWCTSPPICWLRLRRRQPRGAPPNFQFDNIFDNSAAHSGAGFSLYGAMGAGVRRTVAWLDAQGKIEPS